MVAIITSWDTFDKLYAQTSNTPVYAAALLLHPGCRRKYLLENGRNESVNPVLAAVHQLWRDRYAVKEIQKTRSTPITMPEPDAFDHAARLLQFDSTDVNDKLTAFTS
ncbi:hypothetical protein GGS21DRAFT_545886 [Xylaria nigripes]|nr:hypothetical protein GGS21DRAFT_545886 [Xylaria nigripes]